MQPKTWTLERWQFSAAVLLPVILALVITAAGVLGFVFWSTTSIDDRALERQSAMFEHVMEAQRARLEHELASVAVRDDTLINTKLMFNFTWVDRNLGRWMNAFFGHSRTVVLDDLAQPLYLSENGVSVEPQNYRRIASAVQHLVNQVRARAPTSLSSGTASVSDFALVEGQPAIVSVMPITSDTGVIPQSPGTEPLIATIRFLDEATAAQFSREYLFEDGRFTLVRSIGPDRATHPILNSAGRFVAFFEWQRNRPGLTMLRQTGPALAAAFAVAAILVFLLLSQLRRSSAALEAGRRHAEYQAAHDRLTGLPNRMSFDAHLATVLTSRQGPRARLSLLMLDLDRFKQVNDTLGHQAGDELICAVGQRIRKVLGPGVMLARLGGDEFGILFAGRETSQEVSRVAAEVIAAIARPFDLNHFKAHVGVSIGIVNATAGSAEPRELVRKADIALYEAKAGGRNRAVIYEEHMNELLQLQHTIEGELREALQRDDQLYVVFQPLIDQATRKVIGAEALARWRHPSYGQISPARFIPVAENTGLIEALGAFVLRRACATGARWPGRTIAVNISTAQLRNASFADEVFDILRETGMRPQDLELEITESILLDDEHVSAAHLRTFRAAGIHVALDDFGTGYSSLSYLKRYPVDRIKIDRSFVSQLADGHVSVAITQAIVTLAHAMDLMVTAEGVETAEQADILGRLGCNILQGFLFSGGVSADQIAVIFEDVANRRDPGNHKVA
ncbi:MAG TPA: bifunctional diguanylate cyclase/phosphodiesterase [Devosia sp.]|nr:bifunctional diguanylate cyclase/phosphodiesterase [Devosia sp.]